MKKNLVLRIIAAIAAFAIIAFLFSLFNSFMGNPISSANATSKIKKYVKENYPDQDFEISSAKYNFKDASYFSIVQSKTSQDTHFTVNYSRGRIFDEYEFYVENRYTTYDRLQKELSKVVEDIINKEFPYKTSILYADLGKGEEEMKSLTLDMELDIHNPPVTTGLTIYILNEDTSYEFLCARLLELDQIMEQHDIPIDIYNVVVEQPIPGEEKSDPKGSDNHLYDFPAELIDADNLIEVIREHQKKWEEEGYKEKEAEMEQSKILYGEDEEQNIEGASN